METNEKLKTRVLNNLELFAPILGTSYRRWFKNTFLVTIEKNRVFAESFRDWLNSILEIKEWCIRNRKSEYTGVDGATKLVFWSRHKTDSLHFETEEKAEEFIVIMFDGSPEYTTEEL